MPKILNPIGHVTLEMTEAKKHGFTYKPAVRIGLRHIYACAGNLSGDDARAVRWLAGYGRIMHTPCDAMAARLGLEPVLIRAAMVDPALAAEHRARFTGAVTILRDSFEARLDSPHSRKDNPFPPAFERSFGALAKTSVFRKVEQAVKFAEKETAIVRLLAKERIGKSVCAAHQHLRRLDTSAWVRVPSGDGLREFYGRVVEGLGLANPEGNSSNAYMSGLIEQYIGPGKVETLFLDQSHWLWPTRPDHTIARRFEAVMDWWEQFGLNVVLLTTPQDDAQAQRAADNDKHAHGQILGRVTTFKCRDYLDDKDIAAIVRLDASELDEECCGILVEHCKADPGYLGTLKLTIKRIAHRMEADSPRQGETPTAFRRRVVAEMVAKGGAK